jgi:hypothetical protein
MMEELGETTSKAGTIKHFFEGELAEWRDFESTVGDWYLDSKTQAQFESCKDKSVERHPDIRKMNAYAKGTELGQAGAEITLSARFYENVALDVLHASLTMACPPLQDPEALEPSTLQWTFGDSFILPESQRTAEYQPDLVLKYKTAGGGSEVRMVGELKSCATVKLWNMVNLARGKKTTKLFAILGLLHFLGTRSYTTNMHRSNRRVHAGQQDEVRIFI